jgi:hypothetical protein
MSNTARHRPMAAIGHYRLDFQHYRAARFSYWSGGHKTPWPWWEITVPRLGSLILGRRKARAALSGAALRDVEEADDDD